MDSQGCMCWTWCFRLTLTSRVSNITLRRIAFNCNPPGCMSWTWYLANDMQFFIVGLLMLFVYVNNRKAAYGIMTLVVILSNVFGYYKLVHTPSQNQVQDAWYDHRAFKLSLRSFNGTAPTPALYLSRVLFTTLSAPLPPSTKRLSCSEVSLQLK